MVKGWFLPAFFIVRIFTYIFY
ncbi:hypothetical protein [Hufsiella arboris]